MLKITDGKSLFVVEAIILFSRGPLFLLLLLVLMKDYIEENSMSTSGPVAATSRAIHQRGNITDADDDDNSRGELKGDTGSSCTSPPSTLLLPPPPPLSRPKSNEYMVHHIMAMQMCLPKLILTPGTALQGIVSAATIASSENSTLVGLPAFDVHRNLVRII